MSYQLIVRTRKWSNHNGASRITVKWNGKQKTFPYPYNARDPHEHCVRELFPDCPVEQQDKHKPMQRVFHVTV